MRLIDNSFVTSGNKDAEYFCDRQGVGSYIVYDRFFGMWLRQRVTV